MAIVDIRTGKIIGCKKGTLTWWHEKAHIIYNDSARGMRNSFQQYTFLILTISFLVVHLIAPILYYKICAVISLLLFLGYTIYEECWCWCYAYKVMNKKGHQTK